jgi:hypothetical protein
MTVFMSNTLQIFERDWTDWDVGAEVRIYAVMFLSVKSTGNKLDNTSLLSLFEV